MAGPHGAKLPAVGQRRVKLDPHPRMKSPRHGRIRTTRRYGSRGTRHPAGRGYAVTASATGPACISSLRPVYLGDGCATYRPHVLGGRPAATGKCHSVWVPFLRQPDCAPRLRLRGMRWLTRATPLSSPETPWSPQPRSVLPAPPTICTCVVINAHQSNRMRWNMRKPTTTLPWTYYRAPRNN